MAAHRGLVKTGKEASLLLQIERRTTMSSGSRFATGRSSARASRGEVVDGAYAFAVGVEAVLAMAPVRCGKEEGGEGFPAAKMLVSSSHRSAGLRQELHGVVKVRLEAWA